MSPHVAVVLKGLPQYANFTLERLVDSVDPNNVVLIGDESTIDTAARLRINHFHLDDAIENHSLATLNRVFINDGGNDDAFEKFCFMRFLAIKGFMDQTRVDKVIHVDADILFWGHPKELFGEHQGIGLLNEYSTFLSSWNKDPLERFTEWFLDDDGYFSEPPRYRYSDMDALSVFLETKKPQYDVATPEGYDKNVSLDLSFRYFLIEDILRERGFNHGPNSAEGQHLPDMSTQELTGAFRVTPRGLLRFATKENLRFVHLQGDTKKLFKFFEKNWEHISES